MLLLVSFAPAVLPLATRFAAQPICSSPRLRQPPHLCGAAPAEGGFVSFDAALEGLTAECAAGSSAEAAVDSWLDRLDDTFIPTLSSRIEAAPPDSEELPQLQELMAALQERMVERFTDSRGKLQELLRAGEINKMDAQMCGMVKRGEIDAGFLYVLIKNMEEARAGGDDQTLQILTHLHTRVQEELEKRTDPALALLHKLTRTDMLGVRGNILRHYMVPQTAVKLPDGSELPLGEPAPAQVTPAAFAAAVEETIDKVLALPLDRSAVESTAENIRLVAKEARAVVEEAYPADVLDSFTEALTPVFAKAPLPPR